VDCLNLSSQSEMSGVLSFQDWQMTNMEFSSIFNCESNF
jgi:hypothetical protein